jgi:hypothetical protein
MLNSHCTIYDSNEPLTRTLPNDIIQLLKKWQFLNIYCINLQMSFNKRIIQCVVFLQYHMQHI